MDNEINDIAVAAAFVAALAISLQVFFFLLFYAINMYRFLIFFVANSASPMNCFIAIMTIFKLYHFISTCSAKHIDFTNYIRK
jgi:hypothetical protein